MDIGMSYYVNPNTYGLTTNIKDTAVKDKGAYEKAKTHLLRPVDDVAKSLRTPMKLATHSSLDRNNNSVNIALGSTIKLPSGFKLTVKQYGVEVSGQTNLSNQRESQEASDLAGALSTLLRNADGSRKDVGYSTAQINKWNEDVQKVLQYYGIDTSKDFTVNGMPFSKNDKGIFESQASSEAKMAYDMMSANSGNRSNVVNSDSQSDTTRFDRSIMSANNGALPSFVQKAYSQDEYMAYYEEMIERNKENSEVNLFSKYDAELLTMDEINTDDRGISHYAPKAPKEVKDALAEAMDETGYSMGGKMNYISQMLIKQVENSHNGVANPSDIFGSTVESAISAAKELLDRIEHPLEPSSRRGADVQKYIMQEKKFLETFISKLEKNNTINEISPAAKEFEPVFRTLYSDTGVNVSVYKAPDFDSEHPVYKVEMQDKDGNITERMVDVSKVNPRNCDTLDFYAYSANLKETGKGDFVDTVVKAAIARAQEDAEAKSKSWDMTESYDWAEIVNRIMKSEKDYGDMTGFLNWQNFYELLV